MSSKNCKESNDNFNHYKYLVKNNGAQQSARGFDRNHPSRQELEKLAKDIKNGVSVINNDARFRDDVRNDTIALGVNKRGELVVAGNLKERRTPIDTSDPSKSLKIRVSNAEGKKSNERVTYENFGTRKEDVKNNIVDTVKKSDVYKNSGLRLAVVEEKPLDSNLSMTGKAYEHASNHAEMKLQRYSKDNKTSLEAVGVSKDVCKSCHSELKKNDVDVSADHGNKEVTHWRNPDDKKMKVEPVYKENVRVKASLGSHNIDLSASGVKNTIKDNVKNSFKPGASVGIISGTIELIDAIEKDNIQTFADADVLNAKAGKAENLLGIGEVGYANASVFEAKAGVGSVVGGGVSALSAGAHYEYGLNNSVGANLSVVRAQGNLGPIKAGAGLNFDCNASVGVNGIGASFFGMGFHIGPKLSIKTPLLDFSVNIF